MNLGVQQVSWKYRELTEEAAEKICEHGHIQIEDMISSRAVTRSRKYGWFIIIDA